MKADQCSQYVVDIGIAADNPQQLLRNLEAVFAYIEKPGKITMAKCHFRVQQVDFLDHTITSEEVAPQKLKITKFLEKVKFPRSKKILQRHIKFSNY